MPSKKKPKAPVPDRDWKAEHTDLLANLISEHSLKLTDWRIDMYGLLSKALAVADDVKTDTGITVHRTPKGDIVLKKNGKDIGMYDDRPYDEMAEMAQDVAMAVYRMGHEPEKQGAGDEA